MFQLKGPVSSQEGALNPRVSVGVLEMVALAAEVAAELAASTGELPLPVFLFVEVLNLISALNSCKWFVQVSWLLSCGIRPLGLESPFSLGSPCGTPPVKPKLEFIV